MDGETDIMKLLDGLAPSLDPVTYVFASDSKADTFIGLNPIMLFNEAEGVTAIVPLERAEEAGMDYQFECQRITLTIHSALHAVGLLATVTEWLEDEDIPVNVVSAFHHDHLFVPAARAEDALKALKNLSGASSVPETEHSDAHGDDVEADSAQTDETDQNDVAEAGGAEPLQELKATSEDVTDLPEPAPEVAPVEPRRPRKRRFFR